MSLVGIIITFQQTYTQVENVFIPVGLQKILWKKSDVKVKKFKKTCLQRCLKKR